MPETGGYLVSPRLIAAIAAFLDVVGRVEIRFAGAQPDHVAAACFQLAGFLRDRDGRRRLHAGKGVGKKGHDCRVSGKARVVAGGAGLNVERLPESQAPKRFG